MAALALGALAAGCANDPIDRGEPTPTTKYDFGPSHVRGSLARVNSCDDLLRYFQANSTQQIRAELEASQRYAEQWGREGGDDSVSIAATDSAQFDEVSGPTASEAGAARAEAAPDADQTPIGFGDAAGADADAGNGSDTGTNNQEVGVDEADMIKTDGRRVVSIRGAEVIVVELGEGGTATVSGRVALPGDNPQPVSMFLHDDRVMVLGNEWRAIPGSPTDNPTIAVDPGFAPDSDPTMGERSADVAIAYGSSFVTITEISLAGPPAVVDTREIEGSLIDGRMVDGTVRVVVTTMPQLPEPFVDTSGATEQDWREWDRRYGEARIATIEATTIEDWLPRDGDGAPVTGCEDTYLPEDFGGPQTLSVLTFAEGAASMQSTSVVAGGGSVYA
ncbi:MAG: hypothetical protein GX868_02600, partial [Actinobacteria bacterium]|nr:hypothetical protein [Actinomycetota bacterium]